ncbi:Fic/DOC family N-terminal domain-containing protein [Mycolicibacterium wolinskyi]|uniref:Fic/DOC family N-terminal domain-containing protein n=1 Tax=Mycolicibacterium wolinskyi TaxID=59750 RepID=UPI003917B17E
MPFTPRYTITNATTRDLAKIERARGFLEGATLSEEWLDRMGRRALLLEAHHTTHIEGTQLTIEEAAQLWNGADVENVDPDDRRELLNYRNAFDLVASSLAHGEPITETLIRAIHADSLPVCGAVRVPQAPIEPCKTMSRMQ